MVHWRVLFGGFMFVFCLVLISCTITSTFTFHYLLALCMVTTGNRLSIYGSLCYVVTIRAALYL